jgi:hypothetical protein
MVAIADFQPSLMISARRAADGDPPQYGSTQRNFDEGRGSAVDRAPHVRAFSSRTALRCSNAAVRGAEQSENLQRTTPTETNSPRHVGEPRQVQLVGNRHRLGRPVAMLSQNQVRLTAAGIVTLEGIRSVQQDDHVRILFERVVD